ncbi:MAG: hypothetical protein ACLGHN_09475 [Bacteriovoracia bacterium]
MPKIFILLTLFSQTVSASILPPNNLAIPVGQKNEGLSEEQYNLVIDKVETVYRPIVEKMGKKLTINRLWKNSRVNAGTTKKGNEIIINLYGGYPRHSLVTPDGYALVICHELGHHLGGTPRKIFDSGLIGWPSTEGQADYFATLKCLRKVFRNDDNASIVSKLPIPEVVQEKCTLPFPQEWEQALCMRTTLAGISVSAISADIRNTSLPSVETPDETVVDQTFDDHPLPQCRLDTYFQGSICEESSYRSLSDEDEIQGACHGKKGQIEGLRPLCWFKPSVI